MTPFESLLVGHLVGDFLFQPDWQAAGKRHNSAVCAAHAGFYFVGLLLVGFLFLPWWAYPAVVLPHFAVDRLGLARRYMAWFGQEKFATGDYKSWSVVAVDQIIHLACIFPVAALCTRAAPDRLDVALFLLVCIVVSPVLWAAAWRRGLLSPPQTVLGGLLGGELTETKVDSADPRERGMRVPFEDFTCFVSENDPSHRKRFRLVAFHAGSSYTNSADGDTEDAALYKLEAALLDDFPDRRQRYNDRDFLEDMGAQIEAKNFPVPAKRFDAHAAAYKTPGRLTCEGILVDMDPPYLGHRRVMLPYHGADEWPDFCARVHALIEDGARATAVLDNVRSRFEAARAGDASVLDRRLDAVRVDDVEPLTPLPATKPAGDK